MASETGDTLSHYRLVDKLGAGAMGVVYRAEDTTLKRSVALKFLTEGSLNASHRRARFLREARLAAALNHPSVCAIYEIAQVQAGDVQSQWLGSSLPRRAMPSA